MKYLKIIVAILFFTILIGNIPNKKSALEIYMADPEVRIAQKIFCQIKNVNNTYKLRATLDNNLIYEKKENLQAEEVFVADYRSLRAGSHNLVVNLVNGSGNIVAKAEKIWTTLHDGIPKVGINQMNAICKDGIPFFPITSFMLNRSKLVDWPYSFPFDIASCINTLYFEGYYPEHNIATWKDYIHNGYSQGWSVIGPGRWDGFKKRNPRSSDVSKLVEYVMATKDIPGLFGWVWDDEPNLGGRNKYNPAEIYRKWTELTHAYDTNHPVWVLYYGYQFTHNGSRYQTNRMKEYCYLYNENIFGENTAIADIVSLDYYPYEYATWHDWVSLKDYALALDRARKWNYNLFPIATCIETQDLHDPQGKGHDKPCGSPLRNNRGWTPGPDPVQLKNLIWLSVIHGVKAIQLFHYFCPIPKENLVVLRKFKKQIEKLTPVILGPEQSAIPVVKTEHNGGRVDIMVREKDHRFYIIAANLEDEEEKVKFRIGGIPDGTTVEVYDEERTIKIQKESFSDSFEKLGVHIYIFPDNVGPVPEDNHPKG